VVKKKEVIVASDGSALTHNPFAGLASLKVEAKGPPTTTVVVREPRREPTAPVRPSKIRMRLETRGRSGKAVTRIEGAPVENLEVVASKLKKALGCGATIEGSDILLIGSLVERATQWFERAGDLRQLVDEGSSSVSDGKSGGEARIETPVTVAVTKRSPMRRSDVRRGGRVAIVTKLDQPTGRLTHGVVRDLLTNSELHPRGIKVRLETGEIGRVQILYD
jgi:uncharacterized repeat protein (TIGR03833 family)